jgi:hypothetical protein
MYRGPITALSWWMEGGMRNVASATAVQKEDDRKKSRRCLPLCLSICVTQDKNMKRKMLEVVGTQKKPEILSTQARHEIDVVFFVFNVPSCPSKERSKITKFDKTKTKNLLSKFFAQQLWSYHK